MRGFDRVSEGNWLSHDGSIEMFRLDDGTYGFEGKTLGNFIVEGYDFTDLESAQAEAERLVPPWETLYEMVEQTFDELVDTEKLSLARELTIEYGYGFEFSLTYDLEEFLDTASKEELVQAILHEAISNGTDQIRVTSNGDVEQVSKQTLISELDDSRNDIIAAVVDAIDQGRKIGCTDSFERLMESVMDGSWLER